MASDDPWVVVRVKPNQLARAFENLMRQSCECYAPRAMFRGRGAKLSVRPLFPGYAFVRPRDRQWVFLTGTWGIIDVLMGTGERPHYIPDREIAKIRAREGPDGMIRLAAREFSAGERVRLEKGAISLDVIVDGMAGEDRVFVLMQWLGQLTRAEVKVEDLSR